MRTLMSGVGDLGYMQSKADSVETVVAIVRERKFGAEFHKPCRCACRITPDHPHAEPRPWRADLSSK